MPITASDLRRVPLTTGLCGVSILLTLFRWGDRDVRFLLDDPSVAGTEPWRFVTTMFFHGDVIHLLFNLSWLWLLGSALEPMLGRGRLLGLVVLSAFASSAWESALFDGGIGASGVVYALYAFAWVLRGRPGLFGVITRERTHLMVGWFFFCILATALDLWAIANVAHGVGALTGALVGVLVRWGSARRLAAVAGLAGTLAGGYAAASVLRPLVNLSARAGQHEARAGYELLSAGRTEEALPLLEKSVRYRHAEPSFAHNLGLAYLRLGRDAEAVEVLRGVVSARPDDELSRGALADALRQLANSTPPEPAISLLEEAARLTPDDPRAWVELARRYHDLGRSSDAARALERMGRARPSEGALP